MKKYLVTLPLFLLLVTPAEAVSGPTDAQDMQQQIQAQMGALGTPAGNQVMNENQVQTQNQGEETQLQVNTQTMEQLMDMEGLTQEMGNQVQMMVEEQIEAQNQIQTELAKLESRPSLVKKLFGTDYSTLKYLKGQVEQNKLVIQSMQQMQSQITNQTTQTQLAEAVRLLTEQNTKLEERIQVEERAGGLFGWLIRLFYR